MVQPPHPWPKPPPANHPYFDPAGLARMDVSKDSLNLFFCADLPPKSAAYKIMAATVKDDHQTLRQLLSDPTNLPDFVNGHGVSPVMVAAARGNIMTLEILAQHPLVNLQRETRAGWTALHYAAALHQQDAVSSLLKHYANYTKPNRYGEIPFDLAEGPKVQDAFWQHKDFSRYMKKLRPDHPRFRPKDAAPENSDAQNTPAAEDKLRLDFIASAARMALTGQSTIRVKITEEIIKQLETITPKELMDCCNVLREAENAAPNARQGFDWNNLFIATAKSGRDDLIAPLGKFLDGVDAKTLNEALYQCIRSGDAPDAVSALLQMGADPTAKAPAAFLQGSKDQIIAFKAFEARRPEAFRQICLWAHGLPHWKKNKEHLLFDMRLWQGRTFQINNPEKTAVQKKQMQDAITLYDQRLRLRGHSMSSLLEHLDMAFEIGAHDTVAAVYAEARTAHMTADKTAFAKDTGAHILADVLANGDTATAKRLIADGYHLRHATRPDTQHVITRLQQGDFGAALQNFTQAHLDGTLHLPKIETPQDRARALARLAAMTPQLGGRGFF